MKLFGRTYCIPSRNHESPAFELDLCGCQSSLQRDLTAIARAFDAGLRQEHLTAPMSLEDLHDLHEYAEVHCSFGGLGWQSRLEAAAAAPPRSDSRRAPRVVTLWSAGEDIDRPLRYSPNPN